MQDVQKLPRFYPSFGNLAKKRKEKKRRELDGCPTARICVSGGEQAEPS